MEREVWLYCKPWALHFVLFMFLENHLSYRHFLHFVTLLLVTKYYFLRFHRPAAKRGTGITVAAGNSMIFAIRSASDPIHRKRLLMGFPSHAAWPQGCLSLLFLPGCANCFRRAVTVVRECRILLCSVNFSASHFSIS